MGFVENNMTMQNVLACIYCVFSNRQLTLSNLQNLQQMFIIIVLRTRHNKLTAYNILMLCQFKIQSYFIILDNIFAIKHSGLDRYLADFKKYSYLFDFIHFKCHFHIAVPRN